MGDVVKQAIRKYAGIASEDLPRVFEKGFTGFNGEWKKSTEIDVGTTVRIDLSSVKILIE